MNAATNTPAVSAPQSLKNAILHRSLKAQTKAAYVMTLLRQIEVLAGEPELDTTARDDVYHLTLIASQIAAEISTLNEQIEVHSLSVTGEVAA